MAKGQMRGNREARKPKKEKAVVVPPPAAGTQVKLAGGNTTSVWKKK